MAELSLASVSVLVVEDDYFLANDTKRALEQAGAEVIGPCRDIDEALQVLADRRADCAIVDINLGRGPTFAPVRALIEKGIPVLLVTGYDASIVPDELRDIPCLQKPADPGKLVLAVRDLCADEQRKRKRGPEGPRPVRLGSTDP